MAAAAVRELQRFPCRKRGWGACCCTATPVRASWRQGSTRRGTLSWAWGGLCRPGLHQRQARAAMVVSSSVFLVIHPMAAGLSVLPPHPVACHAVFLFPAAVYHVTPAAARRAFRRVPSRRELPLQVVCFLALAAPVSGPLAFTRGCDRARARAVLAACVETAGPADDVWSLRCKGTEVPQARVCVLLLAGPALP